MICIDLRLSVISGIETAQRVRMMERGQDVRIVALTASVFTSERDRVLAAGWDDFLSKPYRSREILDCINRMLGVRYVYGTGTSVCLPVEQSTVLSQEALSVLPEEFREQLERALILLDEKRITTLIQRVRKNEWGNLIRRSAGQWRALPTNWHTPQFSMPLLCVKWAPARNCRERQQYDTRGR